jgi:hypothetical protein
MSSGATELCHSARLVLNASPGSTAHRRGCGFVARQAMESGLRVALGSADSPKAKWRSRFLLLEFLEPNEGLLSPRSRRAHARHGYLLWTWWSGLCHYGFYDLLPSATEIEDRLDTTETWLAGLAVGSLGAGAGVE